MAYIENERKYIVDRGFLDKIYDESIGSVVVKQAYLDINKNGSITQVRFTHNITKGIGIGNAKGQINGVSREEFEWKMDEQVTKELIDCIPTTVYKRRVYVIHEQRKWAVDIYLDKNAPLIIAEIECPDLEDLEDARHYPPEWIIRDVTDDERYYNKYLAFHPYSEWGTIVKNIKDASMYEQAR